MGQKTSVENAKTPADWVTLKGTKEKDVKKDDDAPVSIAERRRRRRTGGN